MKSTLKMSHLTSMFMLCLIIPMAGYAGDIPEPPPPTPVDGTYEGYSPPAERTCTHYTTWTTTYACGTEEVCEYFSGRGEVCHQKEKSCEQSIEKCDSWSN